MVLPVVLVGAGHTIGRGGGGGSWRRGGGGPGAGGCPGAGWTGGTRVQLFPVSLFQTPQGSVGLSYSRLVCLG